jgi:hypothetical protein
MEHLNALKLRVVRMPVTPGQWQAVTHIVLGISGGRSSNVVLGRISPLVLDWCSASSSVSRNTAQRLGGKSRPRKTSYQQMLMCQHVATYEIGSKSKIESVEFL